MQHRVERNFGAKDVVTGQHEFRIFCLRIYFKRITQLYFRTEFELNQNTTYSIYITIRDDFYQIQGEKRFSNSYLFIIFTLVKSFTDLHFSFLPLFWLSLKLFFGSFRLSK